MSKWTVWAVEDDPYSGGTEAFDIGGHEAFEDAFESVLEELRENGAAICAYITSDSGNIWYVRDGLTGEFGYCRPGVTHWRTALEETKQALA